MEEITLKLNPENFAQRCPVCNGHGDLNFGKKICHGCKGRGYLILPIKKITGEEEGEKINAGSYNK
jgi:DnaJ-class molecular chaperone